MIQAEYYALVYICIVILFAMPTLLQYYNGRNINDLERQKEPITKSLFFTIVIIFYIGFRPNSPFFGDGVGYWASIEDHRWEYYTYADVQYQFATKYLMSSMSSVGLNPRIGFFVLATVMYGGAFVAMRKMFPSDTLLAMILFCGNFGTFGGAVNGIKSGMACSMFLCALAYKNNWKVCLLFLLLSFGFHHSLELSIGAFILCLFYNNTKVYYIVWGLCAVIALLHITYFQILFAGFTDEQGAGYLLADAKSEDVQGLRLDFMLYSIAPMLLYWWAKRKYDKKQREYQFVLNVYIVTNSIWLLCMYAAYTNRFVALSWTLMPSIILYPFINDENFEDKNKYLVWCSIGMLAFTFYMTLRNV